MLPKHQRLTSAEVDFVLKNGTASRYGGILVKRVRERTKKRFGILISKKKVEKAHERNTIRRKVYTLLYEQIGNIDPGLYVVSVFDTENLKKDLGRLLTK